MQRDDLAIVQGLPHGEGTVGGPAREFSYEELRTLAMVALQQASRYGELPFERRPLLAHGRTRLRFAKPGGV
ncbi:hypothetical protein GCM10010392_54070 [Streptomyces clavifer]|nr:hypothetical protein GCM10010392_54070 [Streptomyces clavifer]